MNLHHHVQPFLHDTRGATSIEYGMIAAFLSILCLIGAQAIGTKLSSKFVPISSALN